MLKESYVDLSPTDEDGYIGLLQYDEKLINASFATSVNFHLDWHSLQKSMSAILSDNPRRFGTVPVVESVIG